MRKKFISICIIHILCVLLGVTTSAASEQNYTVFNDGFEGDLLFTESLVTPDSYGVVSTEKHSGSKSYSIVSNGRRQQSISKSLHMPLLGTTCTFTAYVKASNTHTNTLKGAQLLVKSRGNEVTTSEVLYDTGGAWKKLTISFTLSEDLRQPFAFSLLWLGKGTVYWDDITVQYGMASEIPSEITYPSLTDTPEIAPNTTFESQHSVGITSGAYSTVVARSGSQSLMIKNIGGSRCAWESGYDVEPLATYRLSLWTFMPQADTSAYVVVHFSPATDRYNYLQSTRVMFKEVYGRWVQNEVLITAPAGTGYYYLDFHVDAGHGELCFIDDISFKKNAEPAYGTFSMTETFYYTDTEKAQAIFSANTEVYDPNGWDCVLSVNKGDTSLYNTTVRMKDNKLVFEFPLPKGKDDDTYSVYLTVKSANEVLGTYEDTFYKMFDRPKDMTQTGGFTDDEGEPFNPSIAYWAYKHQWPYCRELGITVVELNVLDNLNGAWDTLTTLQQTYGLKALVALYQEETSAGEDLAQTRKIVEMLKDHPAVWGWCVDDEPVAKAHDLQKLRDAYELVRKLDPDHPVYTCDMYPIYFEELVQIADILGTDCYPYYQERGQYHIGNCLTEGQQYIAYNNKGMIPVIQFFNRGPTGSQYDYLPSADELQNFIYQSFFTGATGLAYYAFTETVGDKYAYETEMADGLREFAKNDQDIMFDAFVHGKYETVKEAKDEDAWYRIFKDTENNQYYIAALNRSFYDTVTKNVNISDLWDKAILIDEGDTTESRTCMLSGNNLTFRLPKAGTTLTKIIPIEGAVLVKGGKKINSLESGNLSLYFEPATENAMYLATIYDNTSGTPQLQQMNIFTKSEAEIQIMDTENKELKLFVWTKDGLKPLSEPFKYKNKQEVKE